jgi:hypothetical protein
MDPTVLMGLVILAVVGYLLFGKKSAASSSVATAETARVYSKDDSGLTGVAKYLQNHQEADNEESALAITGVARYLQNQPTIKKSGVAKYVARQSLSAKKVSSVGKYIAKQSVAVKKMPVQKTTGVAKYLENNQKTPASSVTKYIAKKVVAAKEIAAAQKPKTGVEKYLRNNQA